MFSIVDQVFETIVNYAILLSELAGVSVLVVTIIKSFIGWIRRKDNIRLYLAQGIALALDFKLGGEVLRTGVA